MSFISKKSSGVDALEKERLEIAFQHTLGSDNKEPISIYSYPCSDWLGGTMVVYLKEETTGDCGVAEYLFVNHTDPQGEASIEMTDRRHVGTLGGNQPISNVSDATIDSNTGQVLLVIKNEASQYNSGDVLQGVALITLIPNML